MLDERMIKATYKDLGDNEEVETDHRRFLA